MTQSETPKSRNPMIIIGTALALGILAGAAVLYVKEAPSGNLTALSGAGSCKIDDKTSARLNASAKGDVAAMLAASEPQSLSGLSFNGPTGMPLNISAFSGKTVLLNLWATWCVPCREEMPDLDALQASAGSDKFEVVAVNVDSDDDEKPRKFLEEIKVGKLTYYQDPSLGIFNELKKRGLVLGLPVTLLIGPDGCLLAGMNGPANWSGADARALIDAALAKDST